MKLKSILFLCLFLTTLIVSAQKKKVNVKGAYQLRMEDAYLIGEAKRLVVDMAKVDALQKQFGASVVNGTDYFSEDKFENNKSTVKTRLSVTSSTVVKGEWIETKKESVEWVLRENQGKQELWLVCKIEGKARELTNVKVDFESTTLSCTDSKGCETNLFEHGEDLFMTFKTAKKGHMSIYMKENDVVYRLFPYRKMKDKSSFPVEADKLYTLFSTKHAKSLENFNPYWVDEYALGLPNGIDRMSNRIYIVFSEGEHGKPILEMDENQMMTTTPEKFTKWLNKNRSLDKTFQIKNKDIVVTKKK